jgi:hypothetical protein
MISLVLLIFLCQQLGITLLILSDNSDNTVKNNIIGIVDNFDITKTPFRGVPVFRLIGDNVIELIDKT